MAVRDEAIELLASIMRDASQSAAARQRAAEAILRADSATPTPTGATLDATDDELLALARGEARVGEGVHPREKGPAVPGAESVPSHAPTAYPDSGSAYPDSRGAYPDSGGPKEDPRTGIPGGPPANGGPKEDPPAKRGRGRPRKAENEPKMGPAVDRQISLSNTPRTPEPWE